MKTEVDILLKMRADLAGARQATQEMTRLQKVSAGFGAALKTGFGFAIAQRATSFVLGTLTEGFRDAIASAQQLRGISENLGISVQAYQVLRDVVEQNGGNAEALNKALILQSKALYDAGQNGGRAFDAYRRLGLSVATLKALTPEQQFEAIAVSIANADDKQKAFAAASEILGAENLPKLRAALAVVAKDGYGELARQAEMANKFMSPEATARINAAMQSIKDAKGVLSAKIGEDLASLLKFMGQEIEMPKPPPSLTGAQREEAKQREADILAEADATRILSNARLGFAELSADATKTETEKRAQLADSLRLQAEQIDRLNQARFRELASVKDSKDMTGEQIKQLAESNQLQAEANKLRAQAKALETGGTSAFARSRERFDGVNDPASNKGFMTAGQGLQAGAMNFVSDVGSAGEQVARVVEGTLGNAVSNVSTGIYGWISGAQRFGDAMDQVGLNLLQTFGQELVTASVKGFTSMLLQYGLTKAKMFALDVLYSAKGLALSAASAAKSLVMWLPSAIASSISSYGVAAAVGVAAVLAAVAANNFAEGGPVVGPGTGTSDSILARLSNGEFVMPAHAVQRVGLPTLEAMRFNRPIAGFAAGGPVSSGASSTSRSSPEAAARSKPTYIVFGEEELRRRMFQQGDFDAHVVRVMRDSRWQFGG